MGVRGPNAGSAVIDDWEVTVSGAKVPVWVSTTTTLAAVVLAVLFWRKGRQ